MTVNLILAAAETTAEASPNSEAKVGFIALGVIVVILFLVYGGGRRPPK